MTTINSNDIQTPTTVEEFRENLVKYYVTLDFSLTEVEGRGDPRLVVMRHSEIPIKDISSLSDIYKITETGFFRRTTEEQKKEIEKIRSSYGGSYSIEEVMEERQRIEEVAGQDSPSITPMVDFDMNDMTTFMGQTGQYLSCEHFFESGKYSTIYTDQSEFLTNSENVKWYTLDNQILREFYMKTLGSFSGYQNTSTDE